MKKLTSILALSTLAFSVSAMANSTDFGTAAENFIDNYNARSAFGTYSQVNLSGTNCSNSIFPVEGYDVTSGASICYDGSQNAKDGTAYIEYTTQSPYGNGGAGYVVYLKDKLTNVNVKLTDIAGQNVPASTLNLSSVQASQDGSKTVIFLKAQDPLYNGDNTMDGQISISGIVVGVDATLVNAEFEAAVKQVSKDALQTDMQELGYFAGSGAEAISLLIDDKTQQAVAGFALKTELPDVSGFAKVTDLPDLTGYAFITQLPDLSGYAKSSEIPSLDGYALKSELPNLSGYALKTEIPSTSGLATIEYVSTIKDLAATADTKATTAGNTANEALGKAIAAETAVQAIDLQAILNKVNDLENKVATLETLVSDVVVTFDGVNCPNSRCQILGESRGVKEVVKLGKEPNYKIVFEKSMPSIYYNISGMSSWGSYNGTYKGGVTYERLHGSENRHLDYVIISTGHFGTGRSTGESHARRVNVEIKHL